MRVMNRSTKLISLAIILAALAANWAARGTDAMAAIQDSEDKPPPFGLAQGQTARLTVFNISERAIVGPEYKFLDSRGNTLAQGGDSNLLLPGQFRSFDFDLPEPPPGISDHFGRIQMRAEVTAPVGRDTKRFRVSLEVFDSATGKTSFVIQPPPEPD